MSSNTQYVILCWNGIGHIPYFVRGYKAAVKEYRRLQAMYGDNNVRMAQIIHDYGEII